MYLQQKVTAMVPEGSEASRLMVVTKALGNIPCLEVLSHLVQQELVWQPVLLL